MNPQPPSAKPPPKRPLIFLLAVASLLAGIATFWGIKYLVMRAGPAPANAAGTGPSGRPTAEAVNAILDSAQAYINKQDLGKAEAILREAVEQYPAEPALLVSYAELLLKQKRPEEACSYYQKAIDAGSHDARTLFAAGTVANMAGQPQRAVEYYKSAQDADPANPQIPLFLGQIQKNLGQLEAAKASLLRSAKIDENVAIAWGTLAEIALQEGSNNIALQHIAKARQLEPRVTVWRLVEARALKRTAKPDEALALLTPLDDTEKQDPAVARVIAECLGMLNRPEEAAAALEVSRVAHSDDGVLTLDTAAAFERAGDKKRAGELATLAVGLGNQAAVPMRDRLTKP